MQPSLSDVHGSGAVGVGERTAAPELPTVVPATFYVATGGNDTNWRVRFPASAIGARIVDMDEKTLVRAVVGPYRGNPIGWRIRATVEGVETVIETKKAWRELADSRLEVTGVRAEFPKHQGAAVWTRPDLARATLARAMREQGIRTVAECDDNYFARHGQNLFLRQTRFGKQERHAHARALASMDANVFSTGWLRDRYWREYKHRFGVQGMPEMHVCHNAIPRDLWPNVAAYDGPVRVGFMGSPSHVWDVGLAYQAFAQAKLDGCRTVMVGYNPANPDPDMPDVVKVEQKDGSVVEREWRSFESREAIRRWRLVVDDHIRWIDPAEYRRSALPVDIGLCPLRTDGFTLGKSDVKAIEYTISGAAVVCWRNDVYRPFWRDGETCLMAGSPREMAEQVHRLVRDPGLRKGLVENARGYVESERGDDCLRREWGAVL